MDLIKSWNPRVSAISFSPLRVRGSCHSDGPSLKIGKLSFPFWHYPLPRVSYRPTTLHAKKRSSKSTPTTAEHIFSSQEEEEDLHLDDFEDGNHHFFYLCNTFGIFISFICLSWKKK